MSLPIVVVPHPLGHGDETVIEQRGRDIAAECVRVLTTPPSTLAAEFEEKEFPPPRGVMPR